jgi:simple sugar transport system ATP-binding protein
MRHITRCFGPVVANDDVSLDLVPGKVHALVGENGAGKTTLMRVLYGLLTPDAGTIAVNGRRVEIRSPADAMRHGLGMVHQHFMLVETLTVAENVTLGREPSGRFGALLGHEAEREVANLASRYRMPVDPKARADTLSVGQQQRVEILKALHRGARVLILDEPTAVLTPQEVDDLFAVLRALRDQGDTVVIITHKLAEVQAIADHVTVMRAGRVVGDGPVREFPSERIAELMVGRRPAPPLRRSPRSPGEPVLEARGLEVRDARGLHAVRGLDLVVRAGEIVGLAGVEGNGQHELVECLAGLRAPASGTIRIGGRQVSGRSPREHTAAGLAHVPSDRLRRGLVPDMTLAENLVLGRLDDPGLQSGPLGVLLEPRTLARRARPLLEAFDVRPPDPAVRASRLSGGNQQKLIAARELTRGARAILAAHPTRGVDLGAVEFIHSRLLAERDAGHAVLLVSSELTEILALADRVLVIYEGRLILETTPEHADERSLGLAMAGRAGDGG